MPVGTMDQALFDELRERVSRSISQWRPGAELADLRPLTGGTSSLTFVVDVNGVEADESTLVLKVAPPGLEPVRNRDVLRQARLQHAVQGPGRLLAPGVLFSDPGAPPQVPPYMAMNMVAGDCLEPVLTIPADRPSPEDVRSRYFDLAQVLAQFHAIVPDEIGLSDEPVVTLHEEVERWTKAFRTLPEGMGGDFEKAERALMDSMPEPMRPGLNHGDFRLGNTLCSGGQVNAVIDWEIWSVGDPRVDVAWFTYFTDDSGHPAIEPGTITGSPSSAEMVAAYEAAVGAPLPDLDWFRALTRYKEAGLTGLLLKRADKDGRELKPAMLRMRPALPRLVQEAIELVS